MSPEQAEGKSVDAHSDVFSFGSLLYEMVTGQQAFQGDTLASTLAAVLRDEPKPASALAEDVPPQFTQLIERCLSEDADRRFQSMADLKVALEAVKPGTGASIPPSAKPRRRRRWFLLRKTVRSAASSLCRYPFEPEEQFAVNK
jgi:eukaryotic-like serine/threonine-protein kinase